MQTRNVVLWIQIKPLRQYFCMVLFVLLVFHTKKFGIFLGFRFLTLKRGSIVNVPFSEIYSFSAIVGMYAGQ